MPTDEEKLLAILNGDDEYVEGAADFLEELKKSDRVLAAALEQILPPEEIIRQAKDEEHNAKIQARRDEKLARKRARREAEKQRRKKR